jgi:hypothetical protein
MLQLFAESVKKGEIVEPLCSAEEGLVTARAIDDAVRKASHRFLAR